MPPESREITDLRLLNVDNYKSPESVKDGIGLISALVEMSLLEVGKELTVESLWLIVERSFWTALRSFIYKEQMRHKADVVNARLDDGVLARKGYPLIQLPPNYWIDAE